MLDLGFLIALTAWSAGVGLRLLRRFGPIPENPLDALGLAVPLGLGTLGLAVLGLGEVGALGRDGIGFLLAGGAIVGLLGRRRRERFHASSFPVGPAVPAGESLGRHSRPYGERSGRETASPASLERPDRVLAVLLAAGLAGTLLTALGPVTDGDALCYHLQVPKRFLARGSVFFDPDLHETVYPLLTEMLYAVALAVRGPVACRLVQWLLGVVFALNVNALARPTLGRRAWWAGAVALLVPAVSNGMSAPLNDVALAAFGASVLAAWSRFRDRPTLRGAVLTGLLTGFAMGVKYPALVLAGLIGLAIGPGMLAAAFFRGAGVPRLVVRRTRLLIDAAGGRRRRRLVHALAFALAAWTAGGCWYARAFWHTGNPVHPFFRGAFGGAGLDEVLGPEKRPLAPSAWNLLTAVGPLTLDPNTFDDVSHEFGPVFLLFLPALLVERPPRRVLGLAAIGYAFLAVCLTQRQSMRFVLTALGPLSVAVAWLATVWWERRTTAGRLLVGALLVALGMESALAVARARHGLPVVIGRESVDHFLARREPTYRVGRWVAENLPGSARIIGQDHRGYYIPRDYAMELAHRRRTGVGRNGEQAAVVLAEFRRSGFTHLLLCPPVPETAVEFDPTLTRRLEPWLDRVAPAFREDLSDADGVLRRYAIYDLDAVGRAVRLDPDAARVLR